MQSFIVSQKSKTVGGQAIAITGATNAAPISVTATAHGLETGDIVQNAGIGGNLAANGQFVITKTGTDTFTLNNSNGSGNYTSGGTAAHVGYATAGLDVSNVLWGNVPNNLTAVVKLESAPVNVTCRAILEDSADVNFVSAMPAFTTAFAGGVAPGNDLRRAFRYWDDPDTRLAASGDSMRLKIMWGKPVVGAVFQFSAFLEY
jgi:Ubiquitin-activating enzyme E1 FCCH domain